MKAIIFVLVLVCLASVVSALPLCGDEPEIKTNCSMLTPSIVCGEYNYTIFNMSGQEVENGNLSLLNGSVYYFNFTLGVGEYVIKICDGGVREVAVKEEGGSMIIAVIILLPMILGFFFLLGGISLDREHHAAIKIFLFMLSTLTFWASTYMGLTALKRFYEFDALVTAIDQTMFWVGWVFFVIIAYFLIYLLYLAFRRPEKAELEELRY